MITNTTPQMIHPASVPPPGAGWMLQVATSPDGRLALRGELDLLSVPALQEEARVDPKTGLFNARYFARALNEELARASRFDWRSLECTVEGVAGTGSGSGELVLGLRMGGGL